MKTKFKYLASLAISIMIALSLTSGKAQEVIHFSDPLNEIGVFLMALMIAVGSGFALFTKEEKNA